MTKRERLEKQINYLSGYFQGRGMFKAIKAMHYAMEYHNGERKGGGKEFSHQFELVSYIIPIFEKHDLVLLEELVCIAFLHDIVEDYGFSKETILMEFGIEILGGVLAVTKKQGFQKILEDYEEYYGQMQYFRDIVVKMCDRLHNLSSMGPVFSVDKKVAYIYEVRTFMIPKAKEIRAKFPEHYQTLTLLIQLLKTYCKLIEESLPAT